MVRTNAQDKTIFEGAAYMSIDSRIITDMTSKRFNNYNNVVEFDQDMIMADK